MEEIDEAFNWLVLILGTMGSSLWGSTHLYPLPTGTLTPKIEIQFMNLLFLPMIVLVISWLSSHLAQNKDRKIILKSFSWIYALLLLWAYLLWFMSLVLQYDVRGTWLGVALIWIPSVVYLKSVRKRYEPLYPDSKFLKSDRIQILFCIIVTLLVDIELIFTAPMG